MAKPWRFSLVFTPLNSKVLYLVVIQLDHKCISEIEIIISNKKVLLRERKRHTARRVVSTPSVVLPGYPPRGGYPDLGTPPGGGGGTRTSVPPPPRGGTRTSVPPPPGGYPDLGTPPPRLPHGILGNVAKHYGIWVPPPPCGQTDGWMEGQTRVKTIPSLVLRTRAVKRKRPTT